MKYVYVLFIIALLFLAGCTGALSPLVGGRKGSVRRNGADKR